MQSSVFESGRLRPCPSYSRRRDRIDLGLLRSLYKGGGDCSVVPEVCMALDNDANPCISALVCLGGLCEFHRNPTQADWGPRRLTGVDVPQYTTI